MKTTKTGPRPVVAPAQPFGVGRTLGSFQPRPRPFPLTRAAVHHRSAPKGRRVSRLHARGTAVTEEKVELPLQLHRLLKVSQAASRDTCKRVIEQISDSPPAVGYTQVSRAMRPSNVTKREL